MELQIARPWERMAHKPQKSNNLNCIQRIWHATVQPTAIELLGGGGNILVLHSELLCY